MSVKLPLKKGDRDDRIIEFKIILDKALLRLGEKNARFALRAERPKQKFGVITERCVKRFQRRVGLKQTGQVDQRTLNALRKTAQIGSSNKTVEKKDKAKAYPTKTHYSPHFARVELDCKCGCESPDAIVKKLTILANGILEEYRIRLGTPVPLLSVYRCETHNAAVGGVAGSQHTKGTAFDPDVNYLQRVYLVSRAKALSDMRAIKRIKGIGSSYPHGGIHGDRRYGSRVEW